jgi:hypothetical protein
MDDLASYRQEVPCVDAPWPDDNKAQRPSRRIAQELHTPRAIQHNSAWPRTAFSLVDEA